MVKFKKTTIFVQKIGNPKVKYQRTTKTAKGLVHLKDQAKRLGFKIIKIKK